LDIHIDDSKVALPAGNIYDFHQPSVWF